METTKVLLVLVGATVCAWCKGVIKAGDPNLPVSHGICEGCVVGWVEQAQRAKFEGKQ